ncbi:hypothetical protein AXF42_Ash017095 [Apostasia shenzhenica]|uniref:Uncharacterized protein n=1 Tax=Apostasia shenzhenica TaxID=1088818 RepID=A0A2H9ZV37_9ASPA|nr:hypothetical protein AXF42_Ash017095 [Apostasia shenzhenica]
MTEAEDAEADECDSAERAARRSKVRRTEHVAVALGLVRPSSSREEAERGDWRGDVEVAGVAGGRQTAGVEPGRRQGGRVVGQRVNGRRSEGLVDPSDKLNGRMRFVVDGEPAGQRRDATGCREARPSPARLRRERLLKIERYKQRLSLLLPAPNDLGQTNGTPGSS